MAATAAGAVPVPAGVPQPHPSRQWQPPGSPGYRRDQRRGQQGETQRGQRKRRQQQRHVWSGRGAAGRAVADPDHLIGHLNRKAVNRSLVVLPGAQPQPGAEPGQRATGHEQDQANPRPPSGQRRGLEPPVQRVQDREPAGGERRKHGGRKSGENAKPDQREQL